MSQISVFVQVHGQSRLAEVQVSEDVSEADLVQALVAAGITLGSDVVVFLDENENPLEGLRERPVHGIKHGCRLHVSRCRRIKTVVNYLEKSVTREFPPGVRVRAVKAWAVREFELDRKDAAEHVLQLCGSPTRPSSDTPLNALVGGHDCALCFDLVPEQRVEG